MDYFTIISQLTQIDDSLSESKVVKLGVPKRLLGPRLFTSYINDLSDSIRSGIYIHAGDTPIYVVLLMRLP